VSGLGGLEPPTSPLSGADVTEDCAMTCSVRLCTAQPVLVPI
jgi:hypothetical protein